MSPGTDFNDTGIATANADAEMTSILNLYGVPNRVINADQVISALFLGPVLATIDNGDNNGKYHQILILGVDANGQYIIFNPADPYLETETISPSLILDLPGSEPISTVVIVPGND